MEIVETNQEGAYLSRHTPQKMTCHLAQGDRWRRIVVNSPRCDVSRRLPDVRYRSYPRKVNGVTLSWRNPSLGSRARRMRYETETAGSETLCHRHYFTDCIRFQMMSFRVAKAKVIWFWWWIAFWGFHQGYSKGLRFEAPHFFSILDFCLLQIFLPTFKPKVTRHNLW